MEMLNSSLHTTIASDVPEIGKIFSIPLEFSVWVIYWRQNMLI